MSPPPVVGVSRAAPVVSPPVIPTIVPMRRGRPQTASKPASAAPKPSPSPGRGTSGDPFAALDAKQATSNGESQDELSARFPTLDQFALLHDSGGKFDFEQPDQSSASQPKDITQRVTEKLADEAFAVPSSTPAKPSHSRPSSMSIAQGNRVSVAQQTSGPRSQVVSQGTMTSPSPPSISAASPYRKPVGSYGMAIAASAQQRPTSQPRIPGSHELRSSSTLPPSRPFLNDTHRSKSHLDTLPLSPASSRPSLEASRPSTLDVNQMVGRSKSASARPRPSSVHLESDMDYLRDRESSHGHARTASTQSRSHFFTEQLADSRTGSSTGTPEEGKIDSNVDFLRAMEEQEGRNRKKEKRSSSGSKSSKRSSMPSISLSSTKTLLAGRFGDAFRRFEGNASAAPPVSDSATALEGRRDLTPIEGSEATGDRSDDDEHEATESLTPEMRRELERRRLAQEERRVEAAAAEHRRRVATAGSGRGNLTSLGGGRATSIQNKVKTLLGENDKPSPSRAEQERPTDARGTSQLPPSYRSGPSGPPLRTVPSSQQPDGASPADRSQATAEPITRSAITRPSLDDKTSAVSPLRGGGLRPLARPKPGTLRGGQAEPPGGLPVKPAALAGRSVQPNPGVANDGEDLESDFSKRFPNLSSLEMVETTIGRPQPMGIRTKEV